MMLLRSFSKLSNSQKTLFIYKEFLILIHCIPKAQVEIKNNQVYKILMNRNGMLK